MGAKKWTILGQDPDVLVAVFANVISWFVSTFVPSWMPKLLPYCEYEDTSPSPSGTRCISIGRPGGVEQLRVIHLKTGICTKGYNIGKDGGPFMDRKEMPSDCVVVNIKSFSVNFADCAIRWGLYESAKQFVGWPITPGFDLAGEIVEVGKDCKTFRKGDSVMGMTLFGAYSSHAIVPEVQLRPLPTGWTMQQAASLPTVALTALYALVLGGHYPHKSPYRNTAILIHSASGGVGGMLVQMSKILGLSPVVGVVGRTNKVEAAKAMGCDVVIDKSKEDLWKAAEAASPEGYITIMDANGVSTLMDSYQHLCSTGRVVVFGFHSNLPMGSDMLSPIQWVRMAQKMSRMPKFDPMDMVISSKGVLAFNLSFFSEERDFLVTLFDQTCEWVKEGRLECSRVVDMEMERVAEAHALIMSGKSIGKIVLTT